MRTRGLPATGSPRSPPAPWTSFQRSVRLEPVLRMSIVPRCDAPALHGAIGLGGHGPANGIVVVVLDDVDTVSDVAVPPMPVVDVVVGAPPSVPQPMSVITCRASDTACNGPV